MCERRACSVVRKIPSCSLDSLVRQNDALGCSNNVQRHTWVCNLVAECDTKQDNIYRMGARSRAVNLKQWLCCAWSNGSVQISLPTSKLAVPSVCATGKCYQDCADKEKGHKYMHRQVPFTASYPHHSLCIILTLSAATVTLLTLPSCSTQNKSRQEEP